MSGTMTPLPTCLRSCLQAMRRTPIIATRRISSSTRPHSRRKGPSKPPKAPPLPPAQATPPPRPVRPGRSSSSPSSNTKVLDQLLGLGDRVLLYRAPNNHRSFTILSIGTGMLLTIAAYHTVKLYYTDETGDKPLEIHPFLKAVGIIPSVFLGIAGCVLFSAPSRLLRTITLVGPHVKGVNERAQPILQCVSTVPLPFMKAQTIECSPGRLFGNRTVPAVAAEKGFNWTSIAFADSDRFTRSEFEPGAVRVPRARSSLRNVWPSIVLQTRRMCLREGFYSVHFPEGGGWKVDLQGAEVLENAHPLAAMMTYQAGDSRGVWGRLKDIFSSG